MTPKAESHLGRLRELVGRMLDSKYRAGQAEHGGDLTEKPNLLDEALNEAIDQFVYIATAREQWAELVAERNRLRGERAIMLRKLTQAVSQKDWSLVAEATMTAIEGQLHEGSPAVHF